MRWEEIIGANVRRLRVDRGLSQEALAGEAGLALRHLGRIERGEGNPTIAMVGRIAEVLEIHPAELFEIVA
jgi:transcriptional regulator with XRE-family HTH domain